jgi:hypothetical protein
MMYNDIKVVLYMELAIILVILACVHPIIAIQVITVAGLIYLCLSYPILLVIAVIFILFLIYRDSKK